MAVAVACSWPKREPWELAPLPPDGVESTRLVSGPPLHIDRVRFRSAEVGEPRFFLALVPDGIDGIKDVLIFNHGWWDRPEDVLREMKIDLVYARLLAERKVRPAIIVLPDIRFSNDYRRNAEQFPFNQSLELIVTEVSGLVSQRYGVAADRDHWSIGGFSFGGYVALDVARRYSGRFGSASVFSSFYDEEWTFWPAEPPPAGKLDSRGRGKQTIVAPGPVPRLMLGCGTEDRLFANMADLNKLLTARGIDHEWRTAPGGHTWAYWSSVLEPMLLFHLGTDKLKAAGQS
jgi:enterochelin esterase-like enzyme